MSLLSNVRIIDLSRMLAGPYGSMLLGDLGAEIIKIEEPAGDFTRTPAQYHMGGIGAYFLAINRNKKSVVLDLTTPQGREVFHDLVKIADVVFDNLRPTVLKRIGADYETIKKVNPKIISCSISGFGQDGPDRDLPAYDLTIQARGGAMSITGEKNGAPVRMGLPMGDLAGGMFAALAIASALFNREKTGQGHRLDISLLDCQASLLTYMATYHSIGGLIPKPQGASHETLVPYQSFKTKDLYLVVACPTGAAGTGIGFSEMAYVFATGQLWFKVPPTIRFHLTGKLPEYVMSKDIILFIAGKYSAEVAQYKAVEFSGPLAGELSLSSRMTMSNMAVEIGAKFGFFAPDQKTSDFLKDRTRKPFSLISPDPDAHYEETYEIDVSSLEPQVAFPFSVENVRPISEAREVKIHQAFIGSCTNGRLEDLQMAANIMRGKKVHLDVRLLIIPASWEIYRQAMKEGTLETLIDAGAVIGNPSCGPCFGAHMGLLGSEENCIAAINRNFKGRMGSQKAQVFLASPATVAASAVEGKIADPRNY